MLPLVAHWYIDLPKTYQQIILIPEKTAQRYSGDRIIYASVLYKFDENNGQTPKELVSLSAYRKQKVVKTLPVKEERQNNIAIWQSGVVTKRSPKLIFSGIIPYFVNNGYDLFGIKAINGQALTVVISFLKTEDIQWAVDSFNSITYKE